MRSVALSALPDREVFDGETVIGRVCASGVLSAIERCCVLRAGDSAAAAAAAAAARAMGELETPDCDTKLRCAALSAE